MTVRARNAFKIYVAERLNHPDLASLSLQSHAFNLSSSAREDGISALEMIEELGVVSQALGCCRK